MSEQSEIDLLVEKVQSVYKPPTNLLVSEWADLHRVLPKGSSAEPGPWKTSRAIYLKEMMDACNNENIDTVVFMTSAQVGKTECLINILCYYIDQDPSSILFVQPTLKMAEDFSKDRLATSFEASLKMRAKIKHSKAKDSENTVLHKNFSGGSLSLAGANSSASLAGKPVRLLIIDDLDRPKGTAGQEGDYVKLAEKRTTTFYNRIKIYASTPTIKGLSRIETLYNLSDKRKPYVKCPECKEPQILKFDNIVFDSKKFNKDKKPELKDVSYACSNCGVEISATKKPAMLKTIEWRAEKPIQNIAGFWINELYSPWVQWHEIVGEFLEVKDDPEMLRVFVNTVLSETFEERGEAPSWELIFNRREKYERNVVPNKGLLLVAGADVQLNRIEVEIVAYGKDKESWSIDYRVLPGDTSQPKVWQEFSLLFDEAFLRPDGKRIPLRRIAVDSGYNTTAVYKFGRKMGSDKVMIVKGRDNLSTILGRPTRLDYLSDGKKISGGVQLWGVGVSKAKSETYAYLRLEPPEDKVSYPAGYMHFPDYDESYFKQLTAEELVRRKTKSGYYHYEWKKVRERNEALDCRCYARGAVDSYGIDRFTEKHWQFLEKQLSSYDIYIDKMEKQVKPVQQRPKKRVLSRGISL